MQTLESGRHPCTNEASPFHRTDGETVPLPRDSSLKCLHHSPGRYEIQLQILTVHVADCKVKSGHNLSLDQLKKLSLLAAELIINFNEIITLNTAWLSATNMDLTVIINPSAWSDGHCPHTVNITCRGVTGTARIQQTSPVVE